MLRSVAGIVGGCGAVLVLGSMANAVVLHGGPVPGLPPLPLAAMLLLMHALAGVAAGYLAAWVSGRRGAWHGFAVGVLYVLMAQLAGGAVQVVVHPVSAQPFWFTAVMLAVVVLGAVVGGAARGQAAGGPLRSSDLEH